jgi:hypothetical protein
LFTLKAPNDPNSIPSTVSREAIEALPRRA